MTNRGYALDIEAAWTAPGTNARVVIRDERGSTASSFNNLIRTATTLIWPGFAFVACKAADASAEVTLYATAGTGVVSVGIFLAQKIKRRKH
ncbi:hypothetical protein DFJ67_2666 [Asanoa ferruginea]|uniref:Uncharacterized protein n=1 Tax=Asanoa ferruginea TaxID=53367 RepID=A0A3D9ZHD6_9ACTN|nr:hypothetical protein DFJ67_2666 [Asanoa ferruginea]